MTQKTRVGAGESDESFSSGGTVSAGGTFIMPSAGEKVLTPEQFAELRAEPVSLDGMTAAEALDLLKSLRAKGGSVVIDAPEGRPLDSVVVDAHHYAGEWRDRKTWWFHPISLDMACRVAGWKLTRAGKGRSSLS